MLYIRAFKAVFFIYFRVGEGQLTAEDEAAMQTISGMKLMLL